MHARLQVERGSAAGRLEQLDDVAGRVLQEDLLSAGPLHDVVAERRARATQSSNFRVDVVYDEVDAVPAPRARLGAVGHRPSRGALRSREQQAQVAPLDV